MPAYARTEDRDRPYRLHLVDDPPPPRLPRATLARQEAEAQLAEPRPAPPTAPHTPDPPEWMRTPRIVYDRYGAPKAWADDWPAAEWERRVGRAKYVLELEDMRDVERDAREQEETYEPWTGYRARPRIEQDLTVLNSGPNIMTRAEREERGLTGPWNTRPRAPHPDDLPEAECSVAPWAQSSRGYAAPAAFQVTRAPRPAPSRSHIDIID
uniref:Uncharacterized protein n=1 Tax=Streptomyces sp. NBC_00049 TaxID=2903617 RepID=A0AAU2JL62_9ACTN